MNYFTSTEEQRAEEKSAWHLRRSKGIGGSEVAYIMGVSPYKSAYQLFLEKTGRVQQEDISALPHVQRGINGEKACRMLLEQKHLKNFTPREWQVEGTPFRATDDGWQAEDNVILEIKCMGKKAHDDARSGIVPDHYLLQCQYNLFVSKATKCLFVSYRPEDETMYEIEVLPNPELQKKITDAVKVFWFDHVLADIPPPLTDKDYVEVKDEAFLTLARQYKSLKKMAKEIENSLHETSLKLHAFLPPTGGIMGEDITVARSTRKGAIDYTKLEGVDLEKVRKPNSEFITIRVRDKSDV